MMENDVRRKVEHASSGYERGVYTLVDACSQVLDCITPSNVSDIVAVLHPDMASHLRSNAETAPRNEKDWQDLRLFHVGSAMFLPGFDARSENDDDARMEQSKRDYRKSIEILRHHFEGNS